VVGHSQNSLGAFGNRVKPSGHPELHDKGQITAAFPPNAKAAPPRRSGRGASGKAGRPLSKIDMRSPFPSVLSPRGDRLAGRVARNASRAYRRLHGQQAERLTGKLPSMSFEPLRVGRSARSNYSWNRVALYEADGVSDRIAVCIVTSKTHVFLSTGKISGHV
jgi:hypothetical protein